MFSGKGAHISSFAHLQGEQKAGREVAGEKRKNGTHILPVLQKGKAKSFG